MELAKLAPDFRIESWREILRWEQEIYLGSSYAKPYKILRMASHDIDYVTINSHCSHHNMW